MGAFRLPAATADQDDQAGVRMIGRESQKIVPIAGDEEQAASTHMAHHLRIPCGHWQSVAQFGRSVALLTQHLSDIRGDIVIEKEVHETSGRLIWRATKASISPR